MFDNPYGGALPQNPQNIMSMLASLFKNMGQNGGSTVPGGFMSMKPQGLMSMMGSQQSPQQPQSQPQKPNMTSGINQALDPNKGFMAGLMGRTPITNTPSTSMQNNPFMQMPQING